MEFANLLASVNKMKAEQTTNVHDPISISQNALSKED